ncbi:hypothetical protein DL96DRAFT_1576848 [Flagelloscypha sp. PMI_526]|nr:hypothetical protein DL96DRAFT_1576848 [Flagelloscypha sp. PMI_526]
MALPQDLVTFIRSFWFPQNLDVQLSSGRLPVPQDLYPIICSFCDPPTLTAICLSNKNFGLEASAALYRHVSFNSTYAVNRFVSRASRCVHLIKHLTLFIQYSPGDTESWARLFFVVRHRALSLISLRIMTPPTGPKANPDFQVLAGALLPVATAIRCPGLKELEVMAGISGVNPEGSLRQALVKLNEGDEKKRLNTLCYDWHDAPLSILQRLFDLGGLTRLAITRPLLGELLGATNIPQLLEVVCFTLQELAVCVSAHLDKELQLSRFPNLRVLTLLPSQIQDLGLSWSIMLDRFITPLISISPQLRELRIYFRNCGPSTILSGNGEFIKAIDPQIEVIRVFCWKTYARPPKMKEAENVLKERFGYGKDIRVDWMSDWSDITWFCEPVSDFLHHNTSTE